MKCESLPSLNACNVAIIRLGYVGLPLAVSFATPRKCILTGDSLARRVIGFDINKDRLHELQANHDRTLETSTKDLQNAEYLHFTSDLWSLLTPMFRDYSTYPYK